MKWKVVGITFIIFSLFLVGVVWLMSEKWKTQGEEWKKTGDSQNIIIKSQKGEIDSLKTELSQYGWKSEMLFMCVGVENDSSQFPTIKIYDFNEKEIGKFLFVWKESTKMPHLGDKFYLVSEPKK
jgi:hypothetical protein